MYTVTYDATFSNNVADWTDGLQIAYKSSLRTILNLSDSTQIALQIAAGSSVVTAQINYATQSASVTGGAAIGAATGAQLTSGLGGVSATPGAAVVGTLVVAAPSPPPPSLPPPSPAAPSVAPRPLASQPPPAGPVTDGSAGGVGGVGIAIGGVAMVLAIMVIGFFFLRRGSKDRPKGKPKPTAQQPTADSEPTADYSKPLEALKTQDDEEPAAAARRRRAIRAQGRLATDEELRPSQLPAPSERVRRDSKASSVDMSLMVPSLPRQSPAGNRTRSTIGTLCVLGNAHLNSARDVAGYSATKEVPPSMRPVRGNSYKSISSQSAPKLRTPGEEGATAASPGGPIVTSVRKLLPPSIGRLTREAEQRDGSPQGLIQI